MSDEKKSVYIDWESLKLKPITPEQKRSQKLSAIGKRKSTINKQMNEELRQPRRGKKRKYE
tara:strand:+ start:686 stop:868 length:183 start_codon:yes stop_codon:yes gene_type:complete